MSGKINRTLLFKGLALPALPEEPCVSEASELQDVSMVPMQQIMDYAALGALEQEPSQLLQKSLGELRGRIKDDPDGDDGREALGSYWARVEPTSLFEVLSTEARIWKKYMESENSALVRVAFGLYHRIIQHDNYAMSYQEAIRVSGGLLVKVKKGDLELSKAALIKYQNFLESYFSNREELLATQISAFRLTAQDKIEKVLGDGSADVGEDMLSHLNNLLAVYAQTIFLYGNDPREVDDGINWISRYADVGHPLVQAATGVCASLEMAREYIEMDMQSSKRVTSVQGPPDQGATVGNVQVPRAGVINISADSVSGVEVEELNEAKVIIATTDDKKAD